MSTPPTASSFRVLSFITIRKCRLLPLLINRHLFILMMALLMQLSCSYLSIVTCVTPHQANSFFGGLECAESLARNVMIARQTGQGYGSYPELITLSPDTVRDGTRIVPAPQTIISCPLSLSLQSQDQVQVSSL